jgi:hypothetical protein
VGLGRDHLLDEGSQWCTGEATQLYLGDFNRDGRTDLMCKTATHIWIDAANEAGQVA